METLPVEMVEKIVQQLTPQDLARCSAVCREWREIFNQDWMWEPHCDPELEEPLRTIPCVVTPAFVAPEAENSTLSPISRWKLAFMREKHLWKNWKCKEMMENKKENVTSCDRNGIRDIDFLTDTVVVVWYSNRIDILDVSHVQTALVAKTDNSVKIVLWDRCSVVGSTMLLVDKVDSVDVFNVDLFNKTIKLKHTISLHDGQHYAIVCQEQFYVCSDDFASKLKVFCLNTGKLLKEEPCPVKITQNESVIIDKIKSSPTSDFVACKMLIQYKSNRKYYYKYYIYSLKQLAFLPGPVAEYENCHSDFALQGHWLATIDRKKLEVYNFQTGDVFLSHECSKNMIHFPFEQNKLGEIKIFNNCFVFLVDLGDVFEIGLGKQCLKMYDPSHSSLTTICEMSDVDKFRIINNKFIDVKLDLDRVSVWKLSGQTVEKSDINVTFGHKVNRSFTKVIYKDYRMGTFDIYYLW